jgi:uncharacterized protein (UPF0276 family)
MNGALPSDLPLSAGVGLRAPYFQAFASGTPATGFLEIHPENYYGGGARLEYLAEAASHYPLSFHCVGLSLGSTERPRPDLLKKLQSLTARFSPALVSDHVSWSASGNAHLNDLLPLPYTLESLAFVARNIDYVQQALGRSIAVENPSVYLTFRGNVLAEAEFLNELCYRTGCFLLLDINNLYVNAFNNRLNIGRYLETIDAGAVAEYHLAGHTTGKMLIDTHDQTICNDVWAMYDIALRKIGPRPTLIERDGNYPPLDELLAEAAKAQIKLDAAVALRRSVHAAA